MLFEFLTNFITQIDISFPTFIDLRLIINTYKTDKISNITFQVFYKRAVGLSCVATDPEYHGQELGLRTVPAATQWIEKQSDIDFGIFKCKLFYNRAGVWAMILDMILFGSLDGGALSSESLDVVVLMRLFSEKAIANESHCVIPRFILILRLASFYNSKQESRTIKSPDPAEEELLRIKLRLTELGEEYERLLRKKTARA